MSDRLTFTIHPIEETSSLDLLFKSLENIRLLLRDVDHSIYGRRMSAEWRISSIRSSAPTVALTPARADTSAVETVGEGIRLITLGTDHPPTHFTEPAVENLKKMRRLFRGRDRADSISVSVNDERVASIESDIAQKADRILMGGYHSLGSLQGRLEAINIHNSHTATIWEIASRAPVRWKFPREETERVKDLLDRSVLISGKIFYFTNGAPRSIADVAHIEDATDLRYSARAGFGSIPDSRMREMGAAEWLREVREPEGDRYADSR